MASPIVAEVRVRNLKAVLFDLGNTLVSYYGSDGFRPILRDCLRHVADALGLAIDQSTLEEIYEEAAAINTEPGDYAVRPLAGRLRQLFGKRVELTDSTLGAACEAFLAPIVASAKPDPDAIRVLVGLRNRGIKTAIVSNTPWGSASKPWHDEVRRHGLYPHVDAVVVCADVGWRKPHRAPFEKALELLGVEPHQAAFVGDHPEWDVVGARQAGLHPILLAPGGAASTSCMTIERLAAVLEWIDAHSSH
jgi:HAD superfamily hydrolase (TIGR01509 family)